ncbi:MAG: hypothetical protein ACRELY_22320 [Polyangiaceae bacterium]
MKSTFVRVAALTAVVCLASRSDAATGEPVCSDGRVSIEGRLEEMWLEPIARACEELRSMSDSDVTARVLIASDGKELVIDVTLADGRSAVRRIGDPAVLSSTLEALLAVPGDVPLTTPKSSVEQSTEPTPHEQPQQPEAPPQSTVENTVEKRTFVVEIGGAVGGRLAGQEYVSLAPDAFAEFVVRNWLLAMDVRWDLIQAKSGITLSNFEMDTVGIGLTVGRRIPVGFGDLDVGASPRLIAETQSFESSSGEVSGTEADVRLGALARLSLGRSALRAFAALDGEISPARLHRDVRIDALLPPLPAWSTGLCVGVVLGER